MANQLLYIPEINPVIFYKTTRANIAKYFTKHFEYFMFTERLYTWQTREEFCQIWTINDIIYLQFESQHDPIIVHVLDSLGNKIATFPALIGIPNVTLEPGTFLFQVAINLGAIGITESGCYRVLVETGSGDDLESYISDCQYISVTPIENSICYEYWHSDKYHKDVVWATGIKMQYRCFGHFGFLDKPRADVAYRNQTNKNALLSSKSSKQWPLYHGDESGIPDDHYNIIDLIWSCNNVLVDGKPFSYVDGQKPEFITINGENEYPKRGLKILVEDGLNRSSRIFSKEVDTTKQLVSSVSVEMLMFADTAYQGSSNEIPNFNISSNPE